MVILTYIRIEVSFLNIPSDVTNLVDRFLIFTDQWNESYTSHTMKINSADNSITIKNAENIAELCMAYGDSVIDSTSGVQSWKLKITHSEKENRSGWWFTVIGIVRDDQIMLRKSTTAFEWRWDAQRYSYGFVTGRGYKKCIDANNRKKDTLYGEKNQFKGKGDRLEMILNVKEGTLRYIVNDKDYGNAFVSIDTTKRYRLAFRINPTATDFVFQLY